MRFSTSAVVAFASTFAFVAAQDLSKVPGCALPCFATAVQASGCSLSDTKCQCTTGREAIQNSLMQCAPSRCGADDLNKITQVSLDLCKAAGVTITDVPSATSSGGAAASGAAASGASKVSGSATPSRTPSASGSGMPAQSTGAASAMLANVGAVVLGMAGVLAF